MLHANARVLAARALLDRGAKGGFIERHVDRALTRVPLPPEDRALCRELAYGCVRWQATLDWLIARLVAGRSQRPVVQTLLRLGLYQLLWLDRIPVRAAVHETVETAKQLDYAGHAGFINAVLRAAASDAEALRRELAALRVNEPALGWSHPQWLVTRWQARYGPAATLQLLEWNNTPARVYARANTLRVDPARLLQYWRSDDVSYNFVYQPWLEENLVFELKSHPPLDQLRSFANGFFYVQDPSTLFAVDLLAPKPGERVLDFCAAPGGKTTYIAQRMKNKGTLVAADSAPERLEVLAENCRRLGVECAQLTPAAALDPQSAPPFDRVLLDAPCSNTGVLRRRVDLRWRLTPGELARLAGEQLELLRRVVPFVRPGGVLVYSTCSLEPEENAGVVEAFLREHPAFRLDEAGDVLPMRDGFDGAYAARLVRAEA